MSQHKCHSKIGPHSQADSELIKGLQQNIHSFVVVGDFHTALFATLHPQADSAHLSYAILLGDCNFLWNLFECPQKWHTYNTIWLLHGWCQVKLLLLLLLFCVHHTTMNQCHFMQNHIGRVHESFHVTCHLRFWQNDQDLLCAIAVTQG